MRLSRAIVAFAALLVITGLVLGVLSGFFARLGEQGLAVLNGQPAASAAPSSRQPVPAERRGNTPSPSSAPSATPSSAVPVPHLPAPVLKAAATNQRADPQRVRSVLAKVNRTGLNGVVGAVVLDGTGKTVYATNAGTPLAPASTMKLLTSAAALSLYGPQHRFKTKVVAAGPGAIVLVGGGDPYLASRPGSQPARATLSGLATATAAKLRASSRKSVSLGYDDSLFSGPAWNPLWPAGYRQHAGATSALWVNPKDPNAARSAAGAFAQALRSNGIKVSTIRRTKAARNASEIAAVRSITVSQIVTHLLLVSDNDAAEVMLRQVGVKAGRGGSIAGGRRALQAELTKLGVWTSATVAHDGSGLARQSRVPPSSLVRLLRLAGSPAQAKLRALLTGLPVAGVEGSLRSRFADDSMRPAEGLVRGKTGTLTGVRSLAGYLRTPDGTLLYYSVVVNNTTDDYEAGEWIQRTVTALSTCRCRR